MASTNPIHITKLSVADTRLVTSRSLFGTCIAWMFTSFIIVQLFTYFRHCKKDPTFLKIVVYVTVFLQLMETGAESVEAYKIDSAGWGDPEMYYSKVVVTLDNMQIVFVPVTAFIVQCFYIWRIWKFSKAVTLHNSGLIRTTLRVACVAIAPVSALGTIAGLTIAVQDRSLTLPGSPRWFLPMLAVWKSSTAASDIAITICMMALLLHAKNHSHFGETRDLLSRLILIVLQTGLLTSILALTVLLLYFLKVEIIFSLPCYALGKSEAISLLANLNARKRTDTPMVYGSDDGQAMKAPTKISTMVFSPPNRRVGAGENNESTDVSHHTVTLPQTNSQSLSATNDGTSEEYHHGEIKPSNWIQSDAV